MSSRATAAIASRVQGLPVDDWVSRGLRLRKGHVVVSQRMKGMKKAATTATTMSGDRQRLSRLLRR